jgi:hypothetical protein
MTRPVRDLLADDHALFRAGVPALVILDIHDIAGLVRYAIPMGPNTPDA